MDIINTATMRLLDKIDSCEPGGIVCDGRHLSPSDRALPMMEDIWEYGDGEQWDHASYMLQVLADEHGCYWEDGLLIKGE